MQRVKIFKSIESDVSKLEQEINQWIESSGARVLNITGNIAPQTESVGGSSMSSAPTRYPPSDILVIVVYDVQ